MGKKVAKKVAAIRETRDSQPEFSVQTGRITRRSGIGPEQAGTLNRRLVLDMIRRKGGMSRADLTRETGLTPQATSVIVARLVKSGYLTEIARRTGGKGYPSRIYAIKPDAAYSFGASIESGLLTVVLIDLAGHIVAKSATRLAAPGPDEAFDVIRKITDSQVRTTGIDRSLLVGFGLGIPGRYDKEKAVLIPPMFSPGWRDVPVAEKLRDLLGIPVFWDNDANAAAIGECFRGVGVQFQNLLYLHIGRGIGSGLVLSGEPYRGSEGNAGEIGRIRVHMPHLSDTPLRLSQVATIKALRRRLKQAGNELADPQDITPRLQSGDTVIAGWLDDSANAIAQAMCAAVYLLDIEAIVIGGILSDEATEEIARKVRPMLKQNLFHWNRSPKVLCGTVGLEASAIGAATIPLHSIFAARV